MKIQHILLPSLALGAAAALLPFGEKAVGFSTIGGSLSLSQRDVRVFDNFTDATANNNTTAHPQFPGYTGIEMATWKSGVEWGAELHGDGTGDSLQTVGSGGANFDITWQGNATGIGGTNDNIHSELVGSSGGVLAFTETPIADGWRIRYYDSWTWQDGPANVTSGIDYQGVATHEYGHALGLGHSTVGGATMFASISGTGVSARSIEVDDQDGVKFIYGVKAATKPRITSVTTAPGTVTINGSNFSATGNEVWFTQITNNTTGNPVKVTGVTSGGTQITVSVPALAGPGDVLVRNNGTGHANLSNAFPFTPNSGSPCLPGASYCTAKLTSNFCFPQINNNGGVPSLANPGAFALVTTAMEPAVNGLSFFGTTGQNSSPFNGGTLCILGTLHRMPVKNTGGAAVCTGTFNYTLAEMTAQSSGGALVVAGATIDMQTWFRDPPDPFTVGLSNGYEFQVCP